ncbi:MAG: hypothetical protein QOH73_2697 [Gaiellaceae bacterium]|nr:hypothetical protein [Gaiellaceae bacterium]
MSAVQPSVMASQRARSLALRVEWRLAVLYGVLATTLAVIVAHAHDWFVMTDELLYERLAISTATSFSPLPSIHGELIGNLNQLYPLLVAPVFGHGDVPASLTEAHVLNAIVMTSAALPVFALARELQGSRLWALFAAGVAVAGPWMVLSSFLLTEVVAYPAFVWAVFAIERAIARPSRRADALALALVGLATLSRVQLFVLLPAFVVVALVQELRYREGRSWRSLLRAHDLLFGVVAAVAGAAIVLAVAGRLASALGTYSVTAHGSLVPLGSFELALRHLAVLSLGFGVVPLVLGLGWALVTVAAPSGRRAHGFALLTVVLVLGMAIQVGAFAERFGGSVVRDRYLFYVAPLLLVGTVAFLGETRPRLLAPVLGGLVFMAGIAMQGPTFKYPGLFADSPSSVSFLWLWRLLHVLGGGLRTAYFVAILGAVLTVALVQLLVLWPRAVGPLVAVLTVGVALATTTIAFDRLFSRMGTAGRPISANQGVIFTWIDRQVPAEAHGVAMLPFQTAFGDFWTSAAVWWDAEFWNERIDRSLAIGKSFAWTPTGTFPTQQIHVDPHTGVIRETPADYLVSSPGDTRLQIVADRIGYDRGLQLSAVPKPWRAAWMSIGLTPDGYLPPRQEARIRVFAEAGATAPVRRSVQWKVAVPSEALHPVRFTANGSVHTLSSIWGTQITTSVCVPPDGHADIPLTSTGDAVIRLGAPLDPTTVTKPRHVSVRLTDISLGGSDDPC